MTDLKRLQDAMNRRDPLEIAEVLGYFTISAQKPSPSRSAERTGPESEGSGSVSEAVCLMMVNPQHRWPKCRQCGTTLTLMQVY